MKTLDEHNQCALKDKHYSEDDRSGILCDMCNIEMKLTNPRIIISAGDHLNREVKCQECKSVGYKIL